MERHMGPDAANLLREAQGLLPRTSAQLRVKISSDWVEANRMSGVASERLLSSRNEISYSSGTTVKPVTCDDADHDGFVTSLRLLKIARITASEAVELLGADSRERWTVQADLAHILYERNDFVAAIPMIAEAASEQISRFGFTRSSLRALGDFSTMLAEQAGPSSEMPTPGGEPVNVLDVQTTVYEKRVELLGHQHPDVLLAAANLAWSHSEVGKCAEAMRLVGSHLAAAVRQYGLKYYHVSAMISALVNAQRRTIHDRLNQSDAGVKEWLESARLAVRAMRVSAKLIKKVPEGPVVDPGILARIELNLGLVKLELGLTRWAKSDLMALRTAFLKQDLRPELLRRLIEHSIARADWKLGKRPEAVGRLSEMWSKLPELELPTLFARTCTLQLAEWYELLGDKQAAAAAIDRGYGWLSCINAEIDSLDPEWRSEIENVNALKERFAS